jgi:hypothetical protein
MTWIKKMQALFSAFILYSPFKDCSRGSIHERSAAYRFNREHRHLLLERAMQMCTATMLFYGMGALTEMYKLVWLYTPSYVAVALCFVQIPVLLFGYIYLSRWTQWNSGPK